MKNNKRKLNNITRNKSILSYFKRIDDKIKKTYSNENIIEKNNHENIIEKNNLENKFKMSFLYSDSKDSKTINYDGIEEYMRENVYFCKVQNVKRARERIRVNLHDIYKNKYYEIDTTDFEYNIYPNDNIIIKGELYGNTFDLNRGSRNYLILQPNIHTSITNISSASRCIRQAVLNEYFSGLSLPTSKVMIVGKICHYLIETILINYKEKELLNNIVYSEIIEIVDRLLLNESYAQLIYAGNLDIDEIKSSIEDYIPSIIKWCSRLLCNTLDEDKSFILENTLINFEILGVEDYIEDSIYGLKGRIDITAKVKSVKSINNKQPCVNIGDIIPIEIKTGKSQTSLTEHRAQAIMYSLLLGNRYKITTNNCILLYIKNEGEAILIKPTIYDIHDLIDIRNIFVRNITNKDSSLPDFALTSDSCRFCPMVNACHLHALKDSLIHPHIKVAPNKLDLNEKEINFYKDWFENSIQEIKTNILSKYETCSFTIPSILDNTIIPNVILKSQIKTEKCNYELKFIRENNSIDNLCEDSAFPFSTSITESSIITGQLIRSDKSQIEFMFIGVVLQINTKLGFIIVQSETPISEKYIDRLFNIKLVTSNASAYTPLSFLLDLFINESDEAKKLRNNIINPISSLNNDAKIGNNIKEEIENINNSRLKMSTSHIKAIEHCMNNENYSILWGLPGTGKTTTISSLIYLYYKMKKKVLITSHTNSAVDNILIKLKDLNIPFMRFGKTNSIHTNIQENTFEYHLSTKNEWTCDDINYMMNQHTIFASTCIGMKNILFHRLKPFDVCIVDEATQVQVPLIIGPLLQSKSFILVGDHLQISPLVISKKATLLSQSLFEIFLNTNPNSVISLDRQFRMHPLICQLSSQLYYDNKLVPSPIILDELSCSLKLPRWNEAKISKYNSDIIRSTLKPDTHPIIFIDSSKLVNSSLYQPLKFDACINKTEASLIYDLVEALVSAGISESDIGVLSFYSSQVEFIKNILTPQYTNIEVHTIDRFQGRDKLCIILSFVIKSPLSSNSIIANKKRLNVAFTRARKKLILIGNYDALSQNEHFNQIFYILKDYNSMLN